MRGRRPSRGAGDQRGADPASCTRLATLPLLLFYSFTHANHRRPSASQRYPRYWIGFEMTLQLSLLAVPRQRPFELAIPFGSRWSRTFFRAMNELVVLLAFLCLRRLFRTWKFRSQFCRSSLSPARPFFHKPGRADGVFRRRLHTEGIFRRSLQCQHSEMDTFGLMTRATRHRIFGVIAIPRLRSLPSAMVTGFAAKIDTQRQILPCGQARPSIAVLVHQRYGRKTV